MDYNAIGIFVRVVQTGSFSSAATQLGIPKSTVSKRVSSLEDDLGITLLTRTTRSLKLTDAGRTYYQSCSRAFADLQAAEAETTAAQKSPRGLLRVTVPNEMAIGLFSNYVDQFMDTFPEVDVHLTVTDEVIDLHSSEIDLAIRIGNLRDSSLIARKIGTSGFKLYASPSYIKGRGLPKSPEKLVEHRCLRFTTAFEDSHWDLRNGSKKIRVPISGRFSSNNIASLRAMALEGHGITLLPAFLCHREITEKTLVQVLPQWSTESDPVHLVYPQQKYNSLKLEAFVKFMTPFLQQFFKGSGT